MHLPLSVRRSTFCSGTRAALAAAVLTCAAAAQSTFQHFSGGMPSGASNQGFTENVDFGDIDNDGDMDAVLADGGDFGNEQSRCWINRGFEAGGTLGVFIDRTSTKFPAALWDSRDIEFVDLENDGDLDIYLSNTSTNTPIQSNRWWVNMGGVQAGTLGFYSDQTSTRWSGLGGAGSSIANSQVLPGGGFRDFSCDCDFADLDNDGDLDLGHSSYGGDFGGQIPTRLFLNNGAGVFPEFNPSGFQLTTDTISNGNPGLWCEGTQQTDTTNSTGTNCDVASSALDIDFGDIDGDLDFDLLHGARQELPRMFRNRLTDTGTLSFRDVTGAVYPASYSFGDGHYEQEMGDCDNDNDLDIYGLNWQVSGFNFNDITLTNNGAGVYGSIQVMSGSNSDDNEADFIDYENDGDLDVFVANFSGSCRLYRNNFAGAGFSYTHVSSTELPSGSTISDVALDADGYDLDDDGDTDVIVANDQDNAEFYLRNIRNNADTHAPRLVNLEQAPNRVASCSAGNTVIRVHQYDNQPYYGTWYNATLLQYRVVPGAFIDAPMRNSGGNMFRGEIPCNLVGTIEYRVTSTDNHGNVGTSVTKSYTATCPTGAVAYCTAGTSTNGCVPVITGTGTASASAPNGFVINVTNLEGAKQGLIFYGVSGRKANVWSPGSPSYLCVQTPTQRTAAQVSGGTAGLCNGSFTLDWNAYRAANPGALGQPFLVGQCVNAQAWYRDPPAPNTTNLSGGLEFVVCN